MDTSRECFKDHGAWCGIPECKCMDNWPDSWWENPNDCVWCGVVKRREGPVECPYHPVQEPKSKSAPQDSEGETRLPIKVPPHTPGFRHPEREDPKMIGIVSHDEPSLAELLAIPAPQSPEPDLTGQPQEGEVFVPSEAQRAAASEAIEWLEAQESEGERVVDRRDDEAVRVEVLEEVDDLIGHLRESLDGEDGEKASYSLRGWLLIRSLLSAPPALAESDHRAMDWGPVASIIADGYDVGATTNTIGQAVCRYISAGEPNPFEAELDADREGEG